MRGLQRPVPLTQRLPDPSRDHCVEHRDQKQAVGLERTFQRSENLHVLLDVVQGLIEDNYRKRPRHLESRKIRRVEFGVRQIETTCPFDRGRRVIDANQVRIAQRTIAQLEQTVAAAGVQDRAATVVAAKQSRQHSIPGVFHRRAQSVLLLGVFPVPDFGRIVFLVAAVEQKMRERSDRKTQHFRYGQRAGTSSAPTRTVRWRIPSNSSPTLFHENPDSIISRAAAPSRRRSGSSRSARTTWRARSSAESASKIFRSCCTGSPSAPVVVDTIALPA